jgi:D-alanyl-D-alanine dipeptidase
MVAWAERTGQVHLLDDGYIARRSGHNHGHTVDLGLAEPQTCAPADLGTAWDTLDPASHTMQATGAPLERRLLLKSAMQAAGFQSYWKEWWHFGFPLEGTRARDVPYSCFEAPEGEWAPPLGWEQPGWAPPASWGEAACPKP